VDRFVSAAFPASLVVVFAFHSGAYFASEWGLAALVFLLAAVTALLLGHSVTVDWPRILLPLSLFGLAGWQLLSILWSTGAALPVEEAERTLVYVSASCALLLCLTPARVGPMLTGVAVGATIISVYALATRLAPGTLGGAYDPSSGYQLAKPIGYANGLGLLLVFGATIAAGIALHMRPIVAIPSGVALVPLLVAVYFTFSRGALTALAVALGIMVTLESRPRRAAGMVVLLLISPAVGVLLASRSAALTTPGATLHTAQVEGHRLGQQLVVLCVVAGGATAAIRYRIHFSDPLRRAIIAVLCSAVLAFLAYGIARTGGDFAVNRLVSHVPVAQPLPSVGEGPKGRLFSVSGDSRGDYWTVAAEMIKRDPLLGDGAGAFSLRWLQERRSAAHALDAHNLYLETLGELGPIGLGLLLSALAVPLVALRRGRPAEIAPAAAGAYSAFLVHAALDWDWEIPLLTLLALALAASLVVLAPGGSVVALAGRRRSLALVVAAGLVVCALVAHVGNRATGDAAEALSRGDARTAGVDAARARTWKPWSYEPWQLLGESQVTEGADQAAVASFRHAVALDHGQWSVWLDLALAEQGRDRASALARAADLNPLDVGSARPYLPMPTPLKAFAQSAASIGALVAIDLAALVIGVYAVGRRKQPTPTAPLAPNE
jgi:hypothetical protein